jgi:shikimate dehydrogenase
MEPDDVRGRLSAATTVVGVIGDPVAHSLSPLLHNTAFAALGLDWVSLGFPVPAGSAAEAVQGAAALGIRGLSVTMPHKEPVAALVDRSSPIARRLGAVNCVTFDSGTSSGDNTDGPGLVAALRRGTGFDPAGQRCLVIGAGGAARAAIAALAEGGASDVVVVNRTPERALAAAALAERVGRVGAADEASECDLVVDATPLGMTGHENAAEVALVDPSLFHSGQVVVDLVYDPPETRWLAAARARGATVANGLGMLVHQAALQLEKWTGQTAPVEAMWAAVEPSRPRPEATSEHP